MATTMDQAKRRSERVSGVPNVAYDLLVILTNKLEGIAALEEYKLDAEAAGDRAVSALFSRLEQRMREDVDQLRDLLARRLRTEVLPPDFDLPVGDDDDAID